MPLKCSFIVLVHSSLSYIASKAYNALDEGLLFLAWPSQLCSLFVVVEISSTSNPNRPTRRPKVAGHVSSAEFPNCIISRVNLQLMDILEWNAIVNSFGGMQLARASQVSVW